MSLHDDITRRLDNLEALAKAATGPGLDAEWTTYGDGVHFGRDLIAWFTPTAGIARHIAANDPAAVLRALAEDREVLERHRPGRWPNVEDGYDAPTCVGCGRDDQGDPRYLVPCPDLLSLARRHGIEAP